MTTHHGDGDIEETKGGASNAVEEQKDEQKEAHNYGSIPPTEEEDILSDSLVSTDEDIQTYKVALRERINELQQDSQLYLNIDSEYEYNLSKTSPKFKKMYETIRDHTGLQLVYSQFLDL